MKNRHERDTDVMSEWHSIALIHGMDPAGTILNALRFSLVLSVICAKEGHALDVLRLQEETFSGLCRSMRECLDFVTVDELAAELMSTEIGGPAQQENIGPWGRELK